MLFAKWKKSFKIMADNVILKKSIIFFPICIWLDIRDLMRIKKIMFTHMHNAIGLYFSCMVFPYRFKLTALSSCALLYIDDGLRMDSHSHKTHSHKIIFWIFFLKEKKIFLLLQQTKAHRAFHMYFFI